MLIVILYLKVWEHNVSMNDNDRAELMKEIFMSKKINEEREQKRDKIYEDIKEIDKELQRRIEELQDHIRLDEVMMLRLGKFYLQHNPKSTMETVREKFRFCDNLSHFHRKREAIEKKIDTLQTTLRHHIDNYLFDKILE